MSQSIAGKVREVVSSCYGIQGDNLNLETRFAHIGDDLTKLEVFVDLRMDLEIDFSTEEEDKVETVGQLIEMVQRKVNENVV